MEIIGILIQKLSENEGTSERTGMPWKSAEYLFETIGQYKKRAKFNVRNGQYNLIDRFDSMVGKVVTVSFEIEARQNKEKTWWFNELRAWGIAEYHPEQLTAEQSMASAQLATQRTEGQTAQTAPTGQAAQPSATVAEPHPFEEFKEHGTGDDDLPF